MRKIIICTILWCTASFIATAQPNQKALRQQNIKAERVAYINKGLELTEQQSVDFWDLVNQQELDRKSTIKKYKPTKSFEWMTEEQAEKAILDHFQQQEELVKLDRDYYWKMKKIINPRKIAAYHRLKQAFKRKMLKKIKNKNQARKSRKG